MELLIISGMSGAGKSRVAAVLEDMDFYCVDNMPVALMPRFAEFCLGTKGRYERVALVTDVRARENFDELFKALDEMQKMGCAYKILYMEASVPVIIKRYKETRRRHPLDPEGLDLESAVHREIRMLERIRQRADYSIDTSTLTLGQLQRKMQKIFQPEKLEHSLQVNVVSFGFKYGIPIDADIVLDVRFLPNPFYLEELRPLSGLDAPVTQYLFQYEQTGTFMQLLQDMITFLLPNYTEEGKPSVTICIGCTGGRHRSVAIAQALADAVREMNYPVLCMHRDIDKT